MMDRGEPVVFDIQHTNPDSVTSFIKLFVQLLPHNIVFKQKRILIQNLIENTDAKHDDLVPSLKKIVEEFTKVEYETVKLMCTHFHHIIKRSKGTTNSNVLSSVFGTVYKKYLPCLIDHVVEIFDLLEEEENEENEENEEKEEMVLVSKREWEELQEKVRKLEAQQQ
eukprot:TRINITY_DN3232_c0_g1_i1.p1 TRINITY_DN3232_c0_g1~~TRINITY_DN3232_c0_g1_i1.p1  ORF type:complete len:182 (+),score=38.66 TRINITY_DN3232_c0_g1_i1:47-547(+)